MIKQQTELVKGAIDGLANLNDYARGAEVTDIVFVGDEYFVARLGRPLVIEGEFSDVEPASRGPVAEEIDVMDLIAMHERGERF